MICVQSVDVSKKSVIFVFIIESKTKDHTQRDNLQMMYGKSFITMAMTVMLMMLSACDGQKWSEEQVGSFMLVTQKGGATLGYSPQSGVKLLTADGYAFTNLNRNDTLDAYEDWRLSAQDRAANLASMRSIE